MVKTFSSSSSFIAAGANGTDWRDTSKLVLEALEEAKTQGFKPNIGFIYLSDHLIQDAESIYNLFRSVLNIEHWVGTIGVGLFSNNERFVDEPAISALIGEVDPDDFFVFDLSTNDSNNQEALKKYLGSHDPMLAVTHGDPMTEEDPAFTLKGFEEETSAFTIGGLSSSRHAHLQIANGITGNGLSGVVFSQNIPVATTLSQGCNVIGPARTITRGHDHIIEELDGEKVIDVFQEDLRRMALKKMDVDPDKVRIDEEALSNPDSIPEEYKALFKGEVLLGFPVSQTDQEEYLVRNIVGLNEDESMTVAESVIQGERVLFVHRDDETVAEDLCKVLLELRERIQKDRGEFAPKAAIYVSCLARAFHDPNSDTKNEIQLIREIIGDVPLTGFYAGGEIHCSRLYGYTGILTLFL